MKMRVAHYNHVINRNHGSGGDLREDERHNSSVRPSLHQPGASLSGGFYVGWSHVVVMMAIFGHGHGIGFDGCLLQVSLP